MFDGLSVENIIENGENSFTEFKEISVAPETLAEELVAFLNSRGGSIYLGVSDHGEVVGIDYRRRGSLEETVMNICRNNIVPPVIPDYELIHIRDRWIVRITVAEGVSKPYRTVQGKHFIRIGSTKRVASREELFRLHQNALVLHIDDRPIQGTGPEKLDMNKVRDFFEDAYGIDLDACTEEEQEKILLNACLLARSGTELCATITGLLFFGGIDKHKPLSPIERFFPQAGIQFVFYEDDSLEDIVDRYDTSAACPECIDAVVHKIRLNWKTSSVIKGLRREELAFPEKIFRELVVNAVAHRDYSLQAKVQIRMFPNRVEVLTPGRLINSLTVEKMRHGISIPRNPLIMKYMQSFRYSDQLGRGIPMVLQKIKKMPGCSLDLREEDELFSAVLRWKEDAVENTPDDPS